MSLRLLIVLAIALIAGAYFLSPKNPGDDSSSLLQGISKIRGMTEDLGSTGNKTSTVYKWQDAEGEWHFSNTPPAAGIAHDVQTYRNDSNIIPAPPATKTPAANTQRPTEKSNTRAGLPSLNDAKAALDDARAVQDLNDNRLKTLDAQIDANN